MFTISNGKVTKGQPDGHVFTSNEKNDKDSKQLCKYWSRVDHKITQ